MRVSKRPTFDQREDILRFTEIFDCLMEVSQLTVAEFFGIGSEMSSESIDQFLGFH